MLQDALKILEILNNKGYDAFIVGGYVRDYLLGIKTSDIDICTNAKPKELLTIFENAKVPKEDYGSVILNYKNRRFEITTFRRDIKYLDNRKPEEIEYIDSLDLDVLRRDFTINTICMDKDKNIIDLLNGRKDIENKIIRTVGKSDYKFSEDALRILRALRFATKLKFNLDEEIVSAIKNNKELLRNISYERKKEELDKIFSIDAKYGIKLILDLKLEDCLDIPNLRNISYYGDLFGIWTLLDVDDVYHFTNNEKTTMKSIREALKTDILEPYNLYKYGLYVSGIVASINNIKVKDIAYLYNSIAITSRKDIDIEAEEIIKLLKKKPGKYINEIYEDLEIQILNEKLENNKKNIEKYILDNYK